MTVSSVVVCASTAVGCGALHDAPISNAKANRPVATQAPDSAAPDRQAPADVKKSVREDVEKTASAKVSRTKKKEAEKSVGSTETKAQSAGEKDLIPVAQTSDVPAWVTVINWAQTKLGTPYLWGGNGTADQGGRFDCSGLTKAAYAQAGIELPRVAQDQYSATGVHPKESELRPGDLVFFGKRRNLHHVAIYVGRDDKGNAMMLHAPRTGTRIRFDKVHYMGDYYGATRISP